MSRSLLFVFSLIALFSRLEAFKFALFSKSDPFKFGFVSRFLPTLSNKTLLSPPKNEILKRKPDVPRELAGITVDQSRELFQISDGDFNQNVIKRDGLVVVFFTSTWCAPCRYMQKSISQIMPEYSEFTSFCSCDTDHSPKAAEEFSIRSIPSTLFFKNGKVVSEIVGAVPESVVISQILKHSSTNKA